MARVSLRWALSAPILLGALVLAAYNFSVFRSQEFAELAEQNRARQGRRLAILRGTLEYTYSPADLGEVQREIEARSGFDSITEIMLIDERGVAIASLAAKDVGGRWEALAAAAERRSGLELETLARRAAAQGRELISFSPDERWAAGVVPVVLGPKRVGFLYCEHDLRPLYQAALAKAVRRTAWVAGGIAAVGLAVGLLIEIGIFRRIAKLAGAAKRVTAGEHHHELPSGGTREIAALADSLRSMLGDLVSSEDRLHEHEAFLETVLDSIPAGIAMRDETGRMLFANATYIAESGLPADYAGRQLAEILRPELAAILEREAEAVFSTGGSTVTEQRLPSSGRTFLVHRILLPSVPGQPRRLLGVGLDITDRVALEEQLRQAQKLDAVGRLAAGIAHDFNNFLTIVVGNASELESGLPGGALRERAVEIGEAAQLAAALTRRLLAFTRAAPSGERILEVGALVRGFERLLRSLIGEHIQLALDLAPGAWPVEIGLGQLEQVLLNLAVNARDAMPDGGWLTIRLAGAERDPAGPELRWLKLEVSDTGAGMSAEVRARALEPFFTTKPANRPMPNDEGL